MRPAHYRQLWSEFANQSSADIDTSALQHLARHIALSFVDRYFYSDHFESEYIDLLCEMATHFEDDAINNIGSGALFGQIIETLCDDFEELQTESYNRLMCQVITFVCKHPQGELLDKKLQQFGLFSEQHLYDRAEAIRANTDQRRQIPQAPKKVLVLSRVTIGADIAINSVFCQRLAKRFPAAEIILIGSDKLNQLYEGNARVRIKPLAYTRRGNLIERFNAWLDLLQNINEEIESLADDEFLLFDPDSRLSQLGVLPLLKRQQYFFFNSRGKDSYPKKISIAELANFWLDTVLGPGEFAYPGVWPSDDNQTVARMAVAKSRAAGAKRIITINFGVGGNPRKQLENGFEEKLVLDLLKEPNTCIFLDLGFGDDERQRSERILEHARSEGFNTLCCNFEEMETLKTSNGVIGVECNIGNIAALIGHSDEFIGYDSACQHISAALGIPTYTVFAGSNNVRFIRRWTACGPAVSEIIYVDTLSRVTPYDSQDIVSRLMDRRDQSN